jgi:hypothetical protein
MSEFLMKVTKTLNHHRRQAVCVGRGVWWDVACPVVERPVFIVGCSRAGTTVVYKTFSESKELGSLQRETHDFWAQMHPPSERNWDTHAIDPAKANSDERNRVAGYFYRYTGQSRFVDKNNQNGLSIPYLRGLFPDAFFVYVKRSPGDNINSLMEGWRREDEFATWSNELPVEVAVDDGRYRRWCFFLAEGWRDYVKSSLEEVCAFQYRAMNEAILDAKKLIPERRWIEIAYDDILADPAAEFERAFAATELTFDTPLKDHCASVLARPYNAFSEIRSDKWREQENAARIERVLPGLRDLSIKMGYKPG